MSTSSNAHLDQESSESENTTEAKIHTPSTTDIDVNPFMLIAVVVIAFIFSLIIGFLVWVVEFEVSDHFLEDPGFVLIQTMISIAISIPLSLIAQFAQSIKTVTKWGVYIGGGGGLLIMIMYFPRAHNWMGNNVILLLLVSFVLNILIGLLAGIFFYLIIWGRKLFGKRKPS